LAAKDMGVLRKAAATQLDEKSRERTSPGKDLPLVRDGNAVAARGPRDDVGHLSIDLHRVQVMATGTVWLRSPMATTLTPSRAVPTRRCGPASDEALTAAISFTSPTPDISVAPQTTTTGAVRAPAS